MMEEIIPELSPDLDLFMLASEIARQTNPQCWFDLSHHGEVDELQKFADIKELKDKMESLLG